MTTINSQTDQRTIRHIHIHTYICITWKSKINKNANRVSIEGYSEADVIVDEFAKFFETSGASNSVKRDLEIYLEFTTAYNNYKNNCFVNNKIKSFEFDTVMIESIRLFRN